MEHIPCSSIAKKLTNSRLLHTHRQLCVGAKLIGVGGQIAEDFKGKVAKWVLRTLDLFTGVRRSE